MFHLNDNNIRNFRSEFNRLSLSQRAVSFKMQFINLAILLKIPWRAAHMFVRCRIRKICKLISTKPY